MATFTLRPRGPFSLATSARFLAGFTPMAGSQAQAEREVGLAFRVEGTWEAAGVTLRQPAADAEVQGETTGGGAHAAVVKQAARILSLDHDATAFAGLVAKDPALAAVAARFPGFRPVVFASPWEAAVWGVITQRVPMPSAAAMRRTIAAASGDPVTIAGRVVHVFPGPRRVLELTGAPLPPVKWERLHGLARAALDGKLETEALRAAPVDEALARLRELPGVGEWTAAHILLRGAGTTDVAALEEPRVRRAAQVVYGLAKEPDLRELEVIAEKWRPFRTWVAVLIALDLSRSGQWNTATGKRGGRRTRAS